MINEPIRTKPCWPSTNESGQAYLDTTSVELEEAGLTVPARPGAEGVGDPNTVVVEPPGTRAVTADLVEKIFHQFKNI